VVPVLGSRWSLVRTRVFERSELTHCVEHELARMRLTANNSIAWRRYSSYTDGTVGGVHSQSGGSNPSMHGQVVMEPAAGEGSVRESFIYSVISFVE
jgi:hypothetical protein